MAGPHMRQLAQATAAQSLNRHDNPLESPRQPLNLNLSVLFEQKFDEIDRGLYFNYAIARRLHVTSCDLYSSATE